LTAKLPAPGPRIFKFFETSSSPLVSVMVAGAASENWIVSPLREFFSAARREPAPLSAVLVTVRVAARSWADVVSNVAKHAARARVFDVSLVFIVHTKQC